MFFTWLDVVKSFFIMNGMNLQLYTLVVFYGLKGVWGSWATTDSSVLLFRNVVSLGHLQCIFFYISDGFIFVKPLELGLTTLSVSVNVVVYWGQMPKKNCLFQIYGPDLIYWRRNTGKLVMQFLQLITKYITINQTRNYCCDATKQNIR